jgi:hypothetical protein
MYKINARLDRESPEQGRTGGWAKGWYENESIFVHVQYKFLLQMLRCGLHDDFFADMRRCFPPFFDCAVYGRSLTENVSTIFSSAHDRPAYHGRGYQPRLSGNNAEMVQIALTLYLGERPFRAGIEGVSFAPTPILPSWLFTAREETRRIHHWGSPPETVDFPANVCSFTLFGHTLVTYHNPRRLPTFGAERCGPTQYRCIDNDGREEVFAGTSINGAIVDRLRNRGVRSIAILLDRATD